MPIYHLFNLLDTNFPALYTYADKKTYASYNYESKPKKNNYLLETEELRLLREDFGVGGRLVTEIGVSGMNICSSLLVIFFVVLISGSISLCTSTCDI